MGKFSKILKRDLETDHSEHTAERKKKPASNNASGAARGENARSPHSQRNAQAYNHEQSVLDRGAVPEKNAVFPKETATPPHHPVSIPDVGEIRRKDPNRQKEGILERQTTDEASKPAAKAFPDQNFPQNPVARLVDRAPTSRNDIRISYSRTKVQAIDPEKLKNNKIFSVFDDIECTDQIKILRTEVLRKLNEIGGNSILVTSANPYEGKTFTSINLGVSIAKEFDRTVLIIDADLRKPTKRHTAFSTDFFTLDVELGLTDYLKGAAEIPDILINPGIEKLTLIPGGRPVDNAPELLNSGRMETMMMEIKKRYAAERLIIVDGPAVLPFPDAHVLARYVDGVLPVVEVERTPLSQVRKMMSRLKDALILGTVMNKNKE